MSNDGLAKCGLGFPGGSSRVKTTPAKQEMWVRSLGWEDSLEKGMASHSSLLAWKNPMDRGAWQAIVHGVAKESDMTYQPSNKQKPKLRWG